MRFPFCLLPFGCYVFGSGNGSEAPLQPHMVQRAYIASSDANLRIVMAAMLVAPFVAQPPGILIGLTKSAYNPSWPLVDQEVSAFSGLTSQLKMTGSRKGLCVWDFSTFTWMLHM